MAGGVRAVAETVDYSPPQMELIANVTGQLGLPRSCQCWLLGESHPPARAVCGGDADASRRALRHLHRNWAKASALGHGSGMLTRNQGAVAAQPGDQNLTGKPYSPASGSSTSQAQPSRLGGFRPLHPRRMVRLPNLPLPNANAYWVDFPHSPTPPTLPLPHPSPPPRLPPSPGRRDGALLSGSAQPEFTRLSGRSSSIWGGGDACGRVSGECDRGSPFLPGSTSGAFATSPSLKP